MKRAGWYTILAFLGGLLIWLSLVWDSDSGWQFEGIQLASAPTGGDFTLHSQQGMVDLRDYRGKVIVLYFGYTGCPDICPTNLSLLAAAFNQLTEEELAQVQGLFVSVDPERDTLELLKSYSNYFHPNILGITGTTEEVAKAARLYGTSYRKANLESEMKYLIDHSADSYIIDQKGRLHRTLQHGTPPEVIVNELRKLFTTL